MCYFQREKNTFSHYMYIAGIEIVCGRGDSLRGKMAALFPFFALSLLGFAAALDNGLLLTPPMGWMAWERFACNIDCEADPYNCISENLFQAMADVLIVDGYRDLGYEYICIDDCWAVKERDAQGRLQADPKRFPSGIKALADYMHKRGLKLGIYADMGNATCAGYPGTLGHITTDAETFAEWGVDILKMDGCSSSPEIYETGYPNMSRALNATGRPIAFACSWPAYIPKPNYTKLVEYCNLWRNFHDIKDSWDSTLSIVLHYGEDQDSFQPFAGPGHWNDPDQIIVGDFGLSLDQQRAQMALWAIFAAPLFMSNDLRSISDESKEILLNQEVIAVNQDKMGVQGRLIASSSNDYIFSRPLSFKQVAVAMLNTFPFASPRNLTVDFKQAGLSSSSALVRDLFSHENLGLFHTSFTGLVNPTGVRLLLLLIPYS